MNVARRPAKLFFIDHAPALGGAEGAMLCLLGTMDRQRWEVHVACTGGPLAERARHAGAFVHVLPLGRLRGSPGAIVNWSAGIAKLAGVFRHAGADIAIANTVRGAFYAAPAAKLTGIPFVWYMHDFWLSEMRPRQLWLDALGKWILCVSARRVIAISKSVAAHLPFADKIRVIYDGLDMGRYCEISNGAALAFRRRWGIPDGALLVGTVGRLRPWKGQERFLHAAARVALRIPRAHFAVVGGANFEVADDYAERLPGLAEALGLSGRVVFAGHLDDVLPALAAFDLFVHPGDPEPFGLVNIEAMAAGKAVVAFAHGALPEIVRDGETGRLAPPGNVEALAALIVDLLEDAERRQRMGRAGQQRVAACFSAGRMAAGIEALCEEILVQE